MNLHNNLGERMVTFEFSNPLPSNTYFATTSETGVVTTPAPGSIQFTLSSGVLLSLPNGFYFNVAASESGNGFILPNGSTYSLTFSPVSSAFLPETQFAGDNTNPIELLIYISVGSLQVFFDATGTNPDQTYTYSSTGAKHIIQVGNFSSIKFTGSGAASIQKFITEMQCFAPDTMIATENGNKTVQEIVVGDVLRKAGGGLTTVRWTGNQTIETRFTNPKMINPICISAGALDENVPSRDLLVSPDHAILIDETLINASALVNGKSIRQVNWPLNKELTYYHFETDAHEAILAENTPAETFIDYAGRDGFAGASNEMSVVSEMQRPRVSSKSALPAAIRNSIAMRAQENNVLCKTA